MATAIITQENTGSLPISPSNETYRAYVKLDDKGKVDDVRVVTAGKDGATWKELDKPTKPENKDYVLAIEQTFRTYKVSSIEAFLELIGSRDEAVNVANAAIAAKTNRKINAYLKELNDDETNLKAEPIEVVDTIDMLQEATQRKNLSPMEKTQKFVLQGLRQMFPNATEDELTAQVNTMISAIQL